MNNSVLTREREVTVYNTIGNNQKSIRTAAANWGQLQEDLGRHGINFANMTAVIGETQVTLESTQAQLLGEPFTLFLMPQKVKSGADIDPDYGIRAEDEDWNFEDPELYSFINEQEQAKARLQKAVILLNKVTGYLCDDCHKPVSDPQVSALQRTAEEIQRNMNLFS